MIILQNSNVFLDVGKINSDRYGLPLLFPT